MLRTTPLSLKETVIIEGSLNKQTKTMLGKTPWVPRYFQLTCTKLYEYYKQPLDFSDMDDDQTKSRRNKTEEKKRNWPINSVGIVDLIQKSNLEKQKSKQSKMKFLCKGSKNDSVFKIWFKNGSELLLKAANPQEAKNWVLKIKQSRDHQRKHQKEISVCSSVSRLSIKIHFISSPCSKTLKHKTSNSLSFNSSMPIESLENINYLHSSRSLKSPRTNSFIPRQESFVYSPIQTPKERFNKRRTRSVTLGKSDDLELIDDFSGEQKHSPISTPRHASEHTHSVSTYQMKHNDKTIMYAGIPNERGRKVERKHDENKEMERENKIKYQLGEYLQPIMYSEMQKNISQLKEKHYQVQGQKLEFSQKGRELRRKLDERSKEMKKLEAREIKFSSSTLQQREVELIKNERILDVQVNHLKVSQESLEQCKGELKRSITEIRKKKLDLKNKADVIKKKAYEMAQNKVSTAEKDYNVHLKKSIENGAEHLNQRIFEFNLQAAELNRRSFQNRKGRAELLERERKLKKEVESLQEDQSIDDVNVERNKQKGKKDKDNEGDGDNKEREGDTET